MVAMQSNIIWSLLFKYEKEVEPLSENSEFLLAPQIERQSLATRMTNLVSGIWWRIDSTATYINEHSYMHVSLMFWNGEVIWKYAVYSVCHCKINLKFYYL